MSKRNMIVSFMLVLSFIFGVAFNSGAYIVDAKSRVKTVYRDYADSIEGSFPNRMNSQCEWYLYDVIGDSVKDLIIKDSTGMINITTSFGKDNLTCVLYEDFAGPIYFHKKDKTFWATEEGSGGRVVKIKSAKKYFYISNEYHCEMTSDGPVYYQLNSKGKRSSLSSEKYNKMWEKASSSDVKFNKCTYTQLRKKLRKLSK